MIHTCTNYFIERITNVTGKFCFLYRVTVNDKELKVNIFDMAGHPVFYEVWHITFCLCCILDEQGAMH